MSALRLLDSAMDSTPVKRWDIRCDHCGKREAVLSREKPDLPPGWTLQHATVSPVTGFLVWEEWCAACSASASQHDDPLAGNA